MRSIRWEMSFWLLLGVTATMAALGWVILDRARASLTSEFDRVLAAKVVTLATFLEEDEEGLDFEYDPRAMPEFAPGANSQYFEISVAEDEVVARSPSLLDGRIARPPGDIREPIVWDLDLPDGRAGRAIAVVLRAGPIEEEDEDGEDGVEVADAEGFGPIPEPLVIVARDRRPLQSAIDELVRAIFGAGLAALLAVVLIVALAVRRGLAPLIRLGDRVDDIDVATLSVPLPVDDQPRELRPLSAKLNELLERLDASFRRERRMSANMAHELRAPIAEILSAADVAARWPDDPELTVDAVQTAREVSAEMGRIVDALLRLSRAQIGTDELELVPVDLEEVVADCWRRHRDEIAAKRLSLSIEPSTGEEACTLLGDQVLVELVVKNLVDNAVAHTPAGGRLSSRVERRGELLFWELANAPVDLDPIDLDRMWEPLWTREPSRSGRIHLGLGLALVQSLAEVLDLQIDLALEGGGLVVGLRARVHRFGAGKPTGIPALARRLEA